MMREMSLGVPGRGLVSVLLLGLLALPAAAAPSRAIIPFQGAVAVKPGQPPLDGNPYGARFEIFTGGAGGARVFEDIQPVTIRDGVFSVELGGGATPLNPALARNNPDLWLQITIDTNGSGTYDPAETMQPRIHLGAAPFALHAASALNADNAQTAQNAVTAQTATNAQTAQTAVSAQTAAVADRIPVPNILDDDAGNPVLGLSDEGAFVPLLDAGENFDPLRGGLYRDNVCIAWAWIASDGGIIASYGLRDSDWRSSLELYELRLFNDVVGGDDFFGYSIVASSVDFAQRPEIAVVEPVDGEYFNVTILAFEDDRMRRVQSAFMVQVFGRLN